MIARWIVLAGACVAAAAPASAAVSGRVRSTEGKPLPGATVTAYALETFDARAERVVAGREKQALSSVKAGPDGTFRLEVADAMVGIAARADGFAPGFVTVAQGEPATLSLRPAAPRRGRVTSGGAPVAGAILQWTTNLGDPQSAELLVRTGGDGGYEIPDPDQWAAAVAIFHPGFAPLAASPSPKWPPGLTHELVAGTRIDGRVTDQRSGAGLAGAAIWVDGWPRARSGADGAFVVEHAGKDWSRIEARGAGLAARGKKGTGRITIAARPVRRLTGVVRDSTTRRPVAGVMVTVVDDAARETAAAAITDAGGQYAFPALPPGRYWVYAARSGYESEAPEQPDEALDLRRPASGSRDFELEPIRRVSGVVRDEKGAPVEGATVSLGLEEVGRFYGTFPDLMSGITVADPPVTAADGAFSLPLAKAAGEGLKKMNMQLAVMAWKPGYAAGSTKVSASGAPARITLPAGIAMTGRVADADGAAIADAAITVVEPGPLFTSTSGEMPPSIRTGADGRFSVQVNPGRLFLSVRKPGYAPRVLDRLDPRGGQTEVVLERGAAIRGRVLRADGRGLGGAAIGLQDHALPPANVAAAVTEPDGGFVLADLAAGSYELTVWEEDAGVYATRTVQAPAEGLRVELAPTAAVRGRVLDAATRAPVPRFWIALSGGPQTGPRGDFQSDRNKEIVADDGAFAIEDLPISVMTVTVRAEGYREKTLEGVAVSAEEGAPAIEVALDPGVALKGRVTADGEPVADAHVGAGPGPRTDATASTDENGDFELLGLAAGEATIVVSKQGYRSVRRTADVRAGSRLDVVLTRGLSLAGTVVSSDDAGVPRARVSASSGVLDADAQGAVTDGAGRFTLQGLSPARYAILAVSEDGKAELKDVDITSSGPVRLVIERASRAVLVGTVTGAGEPPSGQPLVVMVQVHGIDGGQAFAMVDSSGAFRIAEAPAGRVSVVATASSGAATRSTGSVELTLAAGTESTVALAFKDEVEVSGTVTRSGGPVPSAMVSFAEGSRTATATTDREGRYRVAVAAGTYAVNVWGEGGTFTTEHAVTQSGVFDIDITGAALRGRVVDGATQAAIAGADVSLWPQAGAVNAPASTAVSTGEGSFSLSSLREGRYRLLTTRKGYGQDVRDLEVTRGGTAEALVEMQPAEGVTVTVTDARDGRALEAIVVVRDAARRIVANRHAGADADGAVTIPLADGAYLLSTSASGYGTATLPIRSPARGVRVALTPGGTLIIESPRPIPGRVKLVQPDGEEYVRCWCNGIAEIKLEGRRTTVENVAAGSYTMELVDAPGITFSRPVVIQEGQATTVAVEVP